MNLSPEEKAKLLAAPDDAIAVELSATPVDLIDHFTLRFERVV